MYGILGSTSTFHSPLFRGMFSYAMIWPACSVAQDYIENGVSLYQANWARASRYGLFGSMFMAPVWHTWIKHTNKYFTKKTLATALKRSIFEQLTYSPLATAYFYFGMSVLERKSFDDCVQEVREKFWPTYKIGLFYWPLAQTVNFYFVARKNRLVFLSAASFVWMLFMAHMKDANSKGKKQEDTRKPPEDPPKTNSFLPVVIATPEKTAITYLGVGFEEDISASPDSIDPPIISEQEPKILKTFANENVPELENPNKMERFSEIDNIANFDNTELIMEKNIACSIKPCFAGETVRPVENVVTAINVEEMDHRSVPRKAQELDMESPMFEVVEAQNVNNPKVSDTDFKVARDVVEHTTPVDTVGAPSDAAFKPVLIENDGKDPEPDKEEHEPDMTEDAQYYDRPWNYLYKGAS